MSLRKWAVLLLACLLSLCVMTPAVRAETATRFENTRQVMLFPVIAQGSGYSREGAYYLQREMDRIFRFPYYEQMDTSMVNTTVSPANLREIAEETGADIVVLPVITEWRQYYYHRIFWDDDDPIVRIWAVIDVYSWKEGDEGVRDDRVTYYKTEEATLVRPEQIMNQMIQKLRKKFPYDRVPKDISTNLSGEVTETGNTQDGTYVKETETGTPVKY